jgi:N-formylglutamate amidohydrolase
MSAKSSPNLSPKRQPDASGRARPVRRDLVTTKGGAVAGMSEERREGPAFVHVAPRHMPLPVLIAVPHAGRAYPTDIVSQMRDAGHSKLRLEDRRIDTVGVDIAKATGTGLLVAHAPRAMLDLNRAADDIDWGMVTKPRGFDKTAFAESVTKRVRSVGSTNARARSGLGLVPRRLPGFGEIWRTKLTHTELSRRIEDIHQPYHDFLERELMRIRDAWGAALLIDLHSMPPLRRRAGEEQAPRIVLGDRYGVSCEGVLSNHAFRYLEQQGCVTAHNRPYSGGYVLDRHASPARGIHGIQIEVCRSTYLDTSFAEPTSGAKAIAQLLAGLVRILGAETAGLGSRGQVAQAAE